MKPTAAPVSCSLQPTKAEERAGKYLSFRLGKEDFAIQVAAVREIMPVQSLTIVPRTPAHLRGLMNLRGKMVPVIDLKRKFGLPESEASPRNSIVVIQVENGDGRSLVGFIVDSVSEVLTLKASEIDDPVPDGTGCVFPHLLGVAKIKGRQRVLLNSNLVFTSAEIQSLEAVLV